MFFADSGFQFSGINKIQDQWTLSSEGRVAVPFPECNNHYQASFNFPKLLSSFFFSLNYY